MIMPGTRARTSGQCAGLFFEGQCETPVIIDDLASSTLSPRCVDQAFSLPHRSIIRDEGDRTYATVVKNSCREWAAEHCAGIQVETIGPILGHTHFERGVA